MSRRLPAAVRDLANEALATWRPSAQWGHVVLGPGLVDEDQALRGDATLILCPLRPSPRDVGTIAFASHHAFFEAELLGVHELPDRTVIGFKAAPDELDHEPAQGKVSVLDPL
jgi:hypothetical protein